MLFSCCLSCRMHCASSVECDCRDCTDNLNHIRKSSYATAVAKAAELSKLGAGQVSQCQAVCGKSSPEGIYCLAGIFNGLVSTTAVTKAPTTRGVAKKDQTSESSTNRHACTCANIYYHPAVKTIIMRWCTSNINNVCMHKWQVYLCFISTT